MKSKLVFFDLDGTLLNTIGDLAVGCDHMLSLRGLPTHTYEQYCSFVGSSYSSFAVCNADFKSIIKLFIEPEKF